MRCQQLPGSANPTQGKKSANEGEILQNRAIYHRFTVTYSTIFAPPLLASGNDAHSVQTLHGEEPSVFRGSFGGRAGRIPEGRPAPYIPGKGNDSAHRRHR